MNSETKNCQNCKQDFVIEPADFEFYNKMKVPPPTWCPQCRLIQRLVWRSESCIFRRKDDATGEYIISSISPSAPVRVYNRKYWYSDAWDASEYAQDYDFSVPFFVQMKKLLGKVPLPSAYVTEPSINSEYCANATGPKDCYMVFAATRPERSLYLVIAGIDARDTVDCHMITKTELCYWDVNVANSYKTMYSFDCDSCRDCLFCRDCVNCSDCYGCAGLRNKNYCFFNEQLSKEEYERRTSGIDLGSHAVVESEKERARRHWNLFPCKYMHGLKNVSCTGEYLYNSKNVRDSYRTRGAEDSRYCQNINLGPVKDAYDYTAWGEGAELIYYSQQVGDGAYNVRFCTSCFPQCREMQYSIGCVSSSNLFGCIGMRKKEYCILNKQYTKEEYERIVPKIIQHMRDIPYVDAKERVYSYGDFFPFDMVPCAYNETLAQELVPLVKDRAEAMGLRWADPIDRDYKITIKSSQLPDDISDVSDPVLNETIECEHGGTCNDGCSLAFRITSAELEFYRKMKIPLPRLCFRCRHMERVGWRNQPNFYSRSCQCSGRASSNGAYANAGRHAHGDGPCPNRFQTAYAPDRPEIVYCEACYQAEIV
jgi:hypothetical protein